MFDIGAYHNLEIARDAEPGLYLKKKDMEEVLLPNKYRPENYEIGDEIKVYVYLDHAERPVATTLTPFIERDTFAFLECTTVSEVGAFLDWGLEKELFVPFAEQAVPMVAGGWYVVYMYLDEKTNRLVASSKTHRFLDNSDIALKRYDKVALLISHISELGANVIINGKHEGLIHKSVIFEDIRAGDKLPGYVRRVRPDGKVDVILQKEGYKSIEPNAQFIYDELQANEGKLNLHDKSRPEEIQAQLGMSKKTFKKAIGALYRDRKIVIEGKGIRLTE